MSNKGVKTKGVDQQSYLQLQSIVKPPRRLRHRLRYLNVRHITRVCHVRKGWGYPNIYTSPHPSTSVFTRRDLPSSFSPLVLFVAPAFLNACALSHALIRGDRCARAHDEIGARKRSEEWKVENENVEGREKATLLDWRVFWLYVASKHTAPSRVVTIR